MSTSVEPPKNEPKSKHGWTIYDMTSHVDMATPFKYVMNGPMQDMFGHKLRTHTTWKQEYKQPPAGKIPGYTGFVQGRQHIHSRTFGDTSRHAEKAVHSTLVTTSQIPDGPQNNKLISSKAPNTSFLSLTFAKDYHIPGYTGFIEGAKDHTGVSYGSATTTQLEKNKERREGQQPSRPRDRFLIAPNPLPGYNLYTKPQKCIPGHIKVLNFVAQ